LFYAYNKIIPLFPTILWNILYGSGAFTVGWPGENAILGPGLKAALEYRLEQVGGQVAGRKLELIIEFVIFDNLTWFWLIPRVAA